MLSLHVTFLEENIFTRKPYSPVKILKSVPWLITSLWVQKYGTLKVIEHENPVISWYKDLICMRLYIKNGLDTFAFQQTLNLEFRREKFKFICIYRDSFYTLSQTLFMYTYTWNNSRNLRSWTHSTASNMSHETLIDHLYKLMAYYLYHTI